MRLLALALLFLLPVLATAQVGVDRDACTFENCGIVLKRGLLRQQYLRGGEPMPNFGPLDLGLPPLAPFVSESPQALAHLESSDRAGRTFFRLGVAAEVAAVLVAADPFGLFPRQAQAAGLVGASGLVVAAIPFGRRSRRERDRAIAVYNASLPG